MVYSRHHAVEAERERARAEHAMMAAREAEARALMERARAEKALREVEARAGKKE